MFKIRPEERDYAFIPDVQTSETNCYGKAIELADEQSSLTGQSLNINGDSGIGHGPNRYKQHGFYFNADNCIACHACESACSEKNDLPPHLAFRSVGYVEGGSYPAYRRINISMACNHCDNPVCLKGCPTRAYTKYAEYGAVLQDPDICFGCGYCTWVCPYNAPQLDPVKGQVSKCNMCVDRLEVGLKPACAAACLGGALDFGIIETKPENREQLETRISGFPTPEITHPNIRFQQIRSLPRDMTRPDSTPLHYERDEQGQGHFRPKAVTSDKPRQWNLKKLLGSHENAHIIFTLCTQAVVGAFLLLALTPMFGAEFSKTFRHPGTFLPLFGSMLILLGIGMLKLNLHLGKPHRFYRGFNNLRHSPVSREIAGVSLFFASLLGCILGSLSGSSLLTMLFTTTGVISGLAGCYYMYRLYRIKARPYWDHWQTGSSFAGSILSLGSLLFGTAAVITQGATEVATLLLWPLATGLLLEGAGLIAHNRYLQHRGDEAAASAQEQTRTFGHSYALRNLLLGTALFLTAALIVIGIDSGPGIALWCLTGLLTLASAVMGRALFYVAVIPTTMPGAFFWRNQGFQAHARESRLAEMPQLGVTPKAEYHELHLKRASREIRTDIKALLIRGTKPKERDFLQEAYPKKA